MKLLQALKILRSPRFSERVKPSELKDILDVLIRSDKKYLISMLLSKREDGRLNFPAVAQHLETPSDCKKVSSSAINTAASCDSIGVLNVLLGKDIDGHYNFQDLVDNISDMTNLTFRIAAENGSINVVNRLLNRVADEFHVIPRVVKKYNLMSDEEWYRKIRKSQLAKRALRNNRMVYEFPSIVEDHNALSMALLSASRNGHIQIIERFLKKDSSGEFEFASIFEDNIGWCFYIAAENGHNNILNMILQSDRNGDYIISRLEAELNKIYLIEPDILSVCAKNGHFNVVKTLLSIYGYKLGYRQKCIDALCYAAENNNHDISLLIASHLFPNGIDDMPKYLQDNKIVRESIRQGQKDRVESNEVLKAQQLAYGATHMGKKLFNGVEPILLSYLDSTHTTIENGQIKESKKFAQITNKHREKCKRVRFLNI